MRVALTAGSRGIDRIDQVLAATIAEVKRRGGTPFIVPAMGSHGGATVEGQLEVLAHYGITESQMDCPIRPSMDVVELGQLPSGERLYTDRIAYTEADLIIPINRVKPHTAFHGTLESGLYKMLAIGLGKQQGAEAKDRGSFRCHPARGPLQYSVTSDAHREECSDPVTSRTSSTRPAYAGIRRGSTIKRSRTATSRDPVASRHSAGGYARPGG